MKQKNPQQSGSSSESEPDPKFIAQQLRKPSGEFAPKVGQKMNQVNKPLYDLTFDVMEFEENDSVLEIGFGTGKFFDKLFKEHAGIQVSGIDYSEEMVEMARESNQENISNGNLKVIQGNSDAIPFPDQSFNKVFCNMVIYFWDEPEEHLKRDQTDPKTRRRFLYGFKNA